MPIVIAIVVVVVSSGVVVKDNWHYGCGRENVEALIVCVIGLLVFSVDVRLDEHFVFFGENTV